MNGKILLTALVLSLSISGSSQEIPKFFMQSPKEGLMEALVYYNIKFPKIVYAQAILETGYFKSRNCIVKNNLFGLYDSRYKGYYHFSHWVQSVEAYKELVQYKYKEGDYYQFLKDIGYARDKNYIIKLKTIVKRYE